MNQEQLDRALDMKKRIEKVQGVYDDLIAMDYLKIHYDTGATKAIETPIALKFQEWYGNKLREEIAALEAKFESI